MKLKAEIEIKNEHLKVLLDYHNGYELDDEYFNLMDRQDIEEEMHYNEGLLEGGFYQCYPLSPTPLGRFILDLYLAQRPKNPSAYEKIMEEAMLNGKVQIVELKPDISEDHYPSQGIVDGNIFPSDNDTYLK